MSTTYKTSVETSLHIQPNLNASSGFSGGLNDFPRQLSSRLFTLFLMVALASQNAAAETVDASLAKGLSVQQMFLQADWVVKSVIIGLALSSLFSWTIFIAKLLELKSETKSIMRLHKSVSELQYLQDVNADTQLRSFLLVQEALQETELSSEVLADREGVKERIVSRFERYEDQRRRQLTRGTVLLATIGSTAPFVGLFGTVWGIMNSFIGIAETQTTSLAVVAPGIAEALLATALGLVAAIPAVVMYNHFARQITAHLAVVTDTASALLRLVSRDLSRDTLTSGEG